MYQKILDAIHARTPGETILVATGSDGIVILRATPMAALLVYRNHDKKPLVQLQVVRGGFVMFKEEDYEKWAEECKAAREGKSSKPARPRPWKKSFGWQQK